MSLPKSRILNTSKGFTAQADVHCNSPEQNTVVNVNVNQPAENKEQVSTEASVQEPSFPPVFERDVEPKQFDQETSNKDNIINALSLILEIVESNPLIVNKFVVADKESLSLLILYLTEADAVDIQTTVDVDCSCVNSSKFVAVEKIYVTKNNEILNFKYQFPKANKVLDDHHISVKFVTEK